MLCSPLFIPEVIKQRANFCHDIQNLMENKNDVSSNNIWHRTIIIRKATIIVPPLYTMHWNIIIFHFEVFLFYLIFHLICQIA